MRISDDFGQVVECANHIEFKGITIAPDEGGNAVLAALSVADQSALDLRYMRSRVDAAVPLMAETIGRDLIQTSTAPSAGIAYLNRITLVKGAYSSVTLSVLAQGATLANSYLGLYDTNLNLLAVSADISTALAAVTANNSGSFSLPYTVTTAGDYYLALLIGSAVTAPGICRGFSGQPQAFNALSPRLAARSNSAALTALPNPFGAILDAATAHRFWMRYQ